MPGPDTCLLRPHGRGQSTPVTGHQRTNICSTHKTHTATLAPTGPNLVHNDTAES